MHGRADENGRGASLGRDIERPSSRLKRKSAPACAPRRSSSWLNESDADLQAFPFQDSDRVFKMRERRVRQATEIDHIGALAAQRPRPRQKRLDGQRRGVDDLGEDADIVVREIGRRAAPPKIGRQIADFVGSAHDRNAKLTGQRIEIAAKAPRQDHAIDAQGARQAAQQDRLGHQGGDLDADVADLPDEGRLAKRTQQSVKARKGEMAGDEKKALAHVGISLLRSRAGVGLHSCSLCTRQEARNHSAGSSLSGYWRRHPILGIHAGETTASTALRFRFAPQTRIQH